MTNSQQRASEVLGFIEALRRLPLTGEAGSAGRDVLGIGTRFTTEVQPGDVIRVGGGAYEIEAIIDDCHLVVR